MPHPRRSRGLGCWGGGLAVSFLHARVLADVARLVFSVWLNACVSVCCTVGVRGPGGMVGLGPVGLGQVGLGPAVTEASILRTWPCFTVVYVLGFRGRIYVSILTYMSCLQVCKRGCTCGPGKQFKLSLLQHSAACSLFGWPATQRVGVPARACLSLQLQHPD